MQLNDEQICDLIRKGNAPAGLRARKLNLKDCRELKSLPAGLHCHTLLLNGSSIETLPHDLKVDFKLDISDCGNITQLPVGLSAPVLVMRNCISLTALPEHLQADYLDAQGCILLAEWPDTARVQIGSVRLGECASLRCLPGQLGPLSSLDLRGCRNLDFIPEGIQVQSWIDLAETAIKGLPSSLARVVLRWRGVSITPQIAFFPETLKVADILAETNAEVRRVMIERIGFDAFLASAGAETLHEDTDPGGQRQLLRVKLPGDEDLVCVSVRCPSTGRHYLIRVPPTMKTCHQAVAWTAGFDNPDEYQPLVET